MTIDTRRRPSSSAGGSERSARHPPSGATSPSAPQSALGGRQRLRDGECHSGVLPVGYHTADRGCGAVIVRCGCVECREGRPRGRASYHCRRDGTGRHGGRRFGRGSCDQLCDQNTAERAGPARCGWDGAGDSPGHDEMEHTGETHRDVGRPTHNQEVAGFESLPALPALPAEALSGGHPGAVRISR